MKGAVGNNRIGAGWSVRMGLSVGLSGLVLTLYVLSVSYYYSRALEHQMEHLESTYPPRGHDRCHGHLPGGNEESEGRNPCTKCILLELAGRAYRQLSHLAMAIGSALIAYLSISLFVNQPLYIPHNASLVSLKIRLDC